MNNQRGVTMQTDFFSRTVAMTDAVEDNVDFKRVYRGGKGKYPMNSDGYLSFDVIDDQRWLRAALCDRVSVAKHLDAMLLTSAPLQCFPNQIFGKTRITSGQSDRKPALTIILEILCKRFIPKDAFFVYATKILRREGMIDSVATSLDGAKLIRRALAYADKASVWEPSDVLKLYESTGFAEKRIVSLCGSWGSPLFAAAMAEHAATVREFLLVDVIDDFCTVLSSSFRWPFDVRLKLDGSTTPFDETLCERFNIVVWNPPYWKLELYDDGNAMQSTTAQSQESFAQWMHTFVEPSLRNAERLMTKNGILFIVVPSIVRFHSSFCSGASAIINTVGLTRDVSKSYIIFDFDKKILNCALDVCPLFVHDRSFASHAFTQGRGDHHEVTHVLVKS